MCRRLRASGRMNTAQPTAQHHTTKRMQTTHASCMHGTALATDGPACQQQA